MVYLTFIIVFAIFNCTLDDLLSVAQDIGIRDANHIIEEIRSYVAFWPDTAKDCGGRAAEHPRVCRQYERPLLYLQEGPVRGIPAGGGSASGQSFSADYQGRDCQYGLCSANERYILYHVHRHGAADAQPERKGNPAAVVEL